MGAYLGMLAVPGLFAVAGVRRSIVTLSLVELLFWLMIGFRYQVGMDWNNYLGMFDLAERRTFAEALLSTEPGFQLLMWFALKIGGGYIFVNAVSALVFCWGLFAVARRCPEPFLAIVTATPLLVVAFAMSGTRQAIAIGIIYYVFAAWDRRGLIGRTVLILAASLFHFSALFVLLFVALASRIQLLSKAFAVIVMGGAVLYFASGTEALEGYAWRYVTGGGLLRAPGAWVQIGALVVPALIYVAMQSKFRSLHGESALHRNLAFASLAAVPAILVSSTGAYRFALYFWPMAMYVWSSIPALIESGAGKTFFRVSFVLASAALLIGWLTFGNNSVAWLPYENWLLQPESARLRR